jgi:outer membrane protein TolC
MLLPGAFTSCMVGPNYHTPDSSVADQWTTNTAVSNKPLNAADAYWWKAFNDPVLNELIDLAYRNNLSLQVAGVRVLEARAQLNKSIDNLFPQQQGLSGGLTYTKLSPSSLSFSPAGLTSAFTMDQVLFSASWEIDFWGKYRRGIQSDRTTFLGTVASYDDALVSLIADVATSYVNIRRILYRAAGAHEPDARCLGCTPFHRTLSHPV